MRRPITSSGSIRQGRSAGSHHKSKRELRRRAAIEPVIGHLKAEHRMGRNHLAHRAGDAINAVLAAAGYNFHLLIKWLELLLSSFLAAPKPPPTLQSA
jgi:transposase, IS5 family